MNVGDYVRTKKGIITKIEKCKNGTSDKLRTKETGIILDLEKWFKDDCVKSSPNIIDLIEEDDFINQLRVSEIIKKTKDSIRFMADSDYEFSTELKEKDIKSIVTKECFESMEYKVGE